MVIFRVMDRNTSRGKADAAVALAVIWLAIAASGCAVKSEIRVPVSPRIAAAKTATMQELLAMLRDYSDKINSLSSSSVKVSLTTGKAESGKLQEYRSAPGYILLRRPASMLFNIQNPLTKTTILELLSNDDRFEIWSPRDNKLYVGRNGAAELELEGNGRGLSFTARPTHIFDAIFPQWTQLDASGSRLMRTEEQDAEGKYYVLTQVRDTGSAEVSAIRRLWIERSQMAVVKEETFTSTGQIAGIVHYSELSETDGLRMPHWIQIERPIDGYSLDLQFKNWRINPDLPDSGFALNPPQGAERIVLKEKARSDKP
jgi:outer membrane lipoprotein-sorting protein